MKLNVLVQPSAKSNELVSFVNSCLKVKIKAAPQDGKANSELIAFLSKFLKLPKKNFKILLGESNKNKVLEISGLEAFPELNID
jgi:uncharacterized protein (TIGR00251 family)